MFRVESKSGRKEVNSVSFCIVGRDEFEFVKASVEALEASFAF